MTVNEIAKRGEPFALPPVGPPFPMSDADRFFALIEKIATTGGSLDTLDRIVALRERVQASEAKSAFDRELAAMQPKLPTIDSTGKVIIYSKADREAGKDVAGTATPMQSTAYATMADINDAIRPALAEYGFALSFRSGQVLDGEHKGKILVTGILSHRDGHREEVTLPPLQYDASGSKNNVQALGSTLSYGRRYATLFLLNISSRAPIDMDDDGKKAGDPGTITAEESAELERELAVAGGNVKLFMEHFKVEAIAALPAKDLVEAQAIIKRKAAKAELEQAIVACGGDLEKAKAMVARNAAARAKQADTKTETSK